MFLIEPGSTFSSREIAVTIWAIVALTLSLLQTRIRRSLAGVIRQALKWKLVAPVAAMMAYVAATVAVLAKVGFWTSQLWKETGFWFLFAGVAVLFSGMSQ